MSEKPRRTRKPKIKNRSDEWQGGVKPKPVSEVGPIGASTYSSQLGGVRWLVAQVRRWLEEPLPILRLELIRFLAPLAILGFLSSRLAYSDEWLGQGGFRVPELKGDYHQPIFIPALPDWAAWSIGVAIVAALLMTSFGVQARRAAGVGAVLIAFAALSDRASTFTVTKLSPFILLVLALSPSGSRYGFDAWRAKTARAVKPTHVVGAVRFFQIFLPVMYSASGIAKARGDWLSHSHVLWSHIHDSYQTGFAWALAISLPAWAWTIFQGATLFFEVGSPLLFSLRWVRPWAFAMGVAMHVMIGLMFGPVVWFALLMISLLVGAYVPERAIEAVTRRLDRFEAGLWPG